MDFRSKPIPRIDFEKCASCHVCIDVCPVDCLVPSLIQGRPYSRRYPCLLPPNRCIGCGECARACPLDAVQMQAS